MTNKPPREFFLFKDGSCIECDGYKVKRPDISESCILLIEAGPALEKIKRLEAENEELKEVISELSKSMSAIADLSSHMKLASTLFALKGDSKIAMPKSILEGR